PPATTLFPYTTLFRSHHAGLVAVGLQPVQEVLDVLGGAGRRDAAGHLHRAHALLAGRVQVARLQFGDRGDDEPQPVRAHELLRRLRQGLLGEAADLAGRLEVAVALGGVGGEPVVAVEAEPGRVAVAGAGTLQPALGRLQGRPGRLGVTGARVGAGLDQAEEAHRAGGGQAPVAFQRGLREVDAL